mmetsp:Transcript_4701/g.14285  ORF Transcript_4701/g.14285 Transcript_4701/m.14285 type:complete len:224 (+) Transcript_4701:151-822(+)
MGEPARRAVLAHPTLRKVGALWNALSDGVAEAVPLDSVLRRVVETARRAITAVPRPDVVLALLRSLPPRVLLRATLSTSGGPLRQLQAQQAGSLPHAEGLHVLAGDVIWKVPHQERVVPQVAARKAEEGEEELGEGGRKVGVNPAGRRTQNLLHLLRVVPVVVDLVPYQPCQIPHAERRVVPELLALLPDHQVDLPVPRLAVQGVRPVGFQSVQQPRVRDLIL